MIEQFGAADIESPVSLAAGFLSQGAGEKGFTDSRGSGDDHVLMFLNPVAGEQIHDHGFIDSAGRFVVNVFGAGIHFKFSFFE